MKYKIIRENEPLDEIVYRFYGSSYGYLELVLKNNVFLYKEGAYLTKGLVINLPEEQKEAKARVTLWE